MYIHIYTTLITLTFSYKYNLKIQSAGAMKYLQAPVLKIKLKKANINVMP